MSDDFEVFTASDGLPAIRMTADAQLVGLRKALANAKDEIAGYKHTQDELMSEVERHHSDFQRISLILIGRATYAELTSAEQEIRNIVG